MNFNNNHICAIFDYKIKFSKESLIEHQSMMGKMKEEKKKTTNRFDISIFDNLINKVLKKSTYPQNCWVNFSLACALLVSLSLAATNDYIMH